MATKTTTIQPQQNQRREIKFWFQPFEDSKGLHVIEKDAGTGVKNRYLVGIASGSKLDGHGERMTENAIADMQEQANSGEILLYADLHGVRSTEDIGRLVKSEILPNGDWKTEWSLYNPSDGMGANTDETINKLWKQMNGLPPYQYKRSRGFSVEGFIPDDGIIQMSDDGQRVIDKVVLDGCVVVPRPAYESSMAYSIYKALGEPVGYQKNIIRKNLQDSLSRRITEEDTQNNYYKQKYRLSDALDNEIESIMKQQGIDQRSMLESLFDEFKGMYVDLVLKSAQIFQDESNTESVDEVSSLYLSKAGKKPDMVSVLKSLHGKLVEVEKQLNKK
jgi:hypothetical protein